MYANPLQISDPRAVALAAGRTLGVDADKLFGGLDKIGTAMTVAGGVGVAAFGLAVHSAADLEHTISGVGAVSGATGAQLQQLSALAEASLLIASADDSAAARQEVERTLMLLLDGLRA